jgi:hypothetical protein
VILLSCLLQAATYKFIRKNCEWSKNTLFRKCFGVGMPEVNDEDFGFLTVICPV